VRARTENGTTLIYKLFVRPDRRGQGVGSMLLSAIEEECPAARYELYTNGKSAGNLRLYERHGYARFTEEQAPGDYTFVHMEKFRN